MERLDSSINSILIIDEHIEKYKNLSSILLNYGITCKIISNSFSGLKELEKNGYDCFFIDIHLKGEKITTLIDRIKILYPYSVVALIVENPTVDLIIEYIKYGIDDVIISPFQWERIEEFLTFYNY